MTPEERAVTALHAICARVLGVHDDPSLEDTHTASTTTSQAVRVIVDEALTHDTGPYLGMSFNEDKAWEALHKIRQRMQHGPARTQIGKGWVTAVFTIAMNTLDDLGELE